MRRIEVWGIALWEVVSFWVVETDQRVGPELKIRVGEGFFCSLGGLLIIRSWD